MDELYAPECQPEGYLVFGLIDFSQYQKLRAWSKDPKANAQKISKFSADLDDALWEQYQQPAEANSSEEEEAPGQDTGDQKE